MARAHIDGGDQRHVALLGFMGAGKSSVGRVLAERLGLPFVDLDEVIAHKANKSISAIFREHGEVGFRAHERAALREALKNEQPMVLALGGGTFADKSMRGWVRAESRTVYLRATAEVLAARISRGSERQKRPLLGGPDPMATIRRLLAERSAAYEEADWVIDTDLATITDVTCEILAFLRPERSWGTSSGRRRPRSTLAAAVSTSSPSTADQDELLPPASGSSLLRVSGGGRSYPVELHAEAGPWMADAIVSVCSGERLAVISDDTVAPLHASGLTEALRNHGRHVSLHTIVPGEAQKSLATAGDLYDRLTDAGLGRKDAIVALGGGVVGDLAGFVASTFMRGIDFVQVPTTTLAAVDASIGGKTAVNTSRGKNLVGTFYPPRAVLISLELLRTQSPRQHAAGLVEALKVAATCDAELFERIEAEAPSLLTMDPPVLLAIISTAITLKAEVVARDEREAGERMVLNYGHTIGHAIEVGEGFRLLHGEAVALGLVAEAQWAQTQGVGEDVCGRITNALSRLGVPTAWREAHIDVAAMAADKKRDGETVRIPVVPKVGTYELQTTPVQTLAAFVANRSE